MVKFRNWCGIGLVLFGVWLLWSNFKPQFKAAGRELSSEAHTFRLPGDPVTRDHVIPVCITYEIASDYRGWGGYLGTNNQLPALSCSVTANGFASRTVGGGEQIRMNRGASHIMSWDLNVPYASNATELEVRLDETASGWTWINRITLGVKPIIKRFPLHEGGLRGDWIHQQVRGGWLSLQRERCSQ